MLRKLTKRITNNFGLKILAAVFAIVLWMVVVNIEDPEKTKGFTIPVTIENNEYLSDMGKTYEILNNTDKISFTVTGKRSIIEELSESDFTAVANLENINDDMTTIPVSVSASRYASQIEINKRDATLKVSVENLQTELLKIIGGIKESTSLLVDSSDMLEQTSHETYTGINAMQTTVANITNGATQQAADAQNASANVQIMGNLITETGLAADELNESADTMKEASDKAAVTIEELKQISEEVKNAISVIADQTNQTNASAQNIQSATQFISEIAAQTNLLSLNASIEAARAGEAGRGFGVVATEIQKLAEQSDTASGNIAQIVNTLIANSEKVVEAMERTRTVIDKQNQYIENTSSAVSGVITELDASVERIRSIEKKTTELEKARNEIIAIIETLSDIAQQNADGTSQTNTAISEMADSFRNIENSTEDLRNTADMLAQNISNFQL